MDHFAGLDVSVNETSVCIVDDAGRILREVKVASEPDALLPVLRNPAYHFKRIGLEAGPLSQWLFSALACTAYGLTAPSSGGPGNRPRRQHENRAGSYAIGGKLELHRAVE